MNKPICPFMSDATSIRYCTENCALMLRPLEDEASECSFKHIGYIARSLWVEGILSDIAVLVEQAAAR